MVRLPILVVISLASLYIIQAWAATDEEELDLFDRVKNYWAIGVANDYDGAVSLDRKAKLPKKLSKAVMMEMEANAKEAGCQKSCLICMSKVKCTKKMKKWLPGRCHAFVPATDVIPLEPASDIPGYANMTAMQQFNGQVNECPCSTRCLKGLANIKCSKQLFDAMPGRCKSFRDQILKEVHKIKGLNDITSAKEAQKQLDKGK
uniref:Secreted luciferase n=1 Tax=Heterostylites major TaxID=503058 RepID=H3JS18_9MAXI|nr:secreted luciferase [Heterostylites major]